MSVVPERLHEAADEQIRLLMDRRPFTLEEAIARGTLELGKMSPPHSFVASCRAAYGTNPVGWYCIADHDCTLPRWPGVHGLRALAMREGIGL